MRYVSEWVKQSASFGSFGSNRGGRLIASAMLCIGFAVFYPVHSNTKQIRKNDDKRQEHYEKRVHSQGGGPPKRGGSKLEGNAPSNYTRGEKQKPVTGSYRNNWNSIFGKEKTKPY